MSTKERTKKSVPRSPTGEGNIDIRVGFLERRLNYLTPKVSTLRSDPDANGVYRTVEFRRGDGTLIQKTCLEHDKTLEINGGAYNKRVTLIYNQAGTEVIETIQYLLKYDKHGCIVSETLMSEN